VAGDIYKPVYPVFRITTIAVMKFQSVFALLAFAASAGAFAPTQRHSGSIRMLQMAKPSDAITSDVSIPYDAAARLAYDQWRKQFNKGAFDENRYAAFQQNYETITVANVVAKKDARDANTEPPADMTLNEYADYTEAEYMAMQSGSAEEPNGAVTSKTDMLGKATEAADALAEAGRALAEAADALADDELVSFKNMIVVRLNCYCRLLEYVSPKNVFSSMPQTLAKTLGYDSLEEFEAAVDEAEGIAEDGSMDEAENEPENMAREARIRSAYLDWCKTNKKEADQSRFSAFSKNFLVMEEYAKESGKKIQLNEYADCTEEEYNLIIKAGKAALPTAAPKKATPTQSPEVDSKKKTELDAKINAEIELKTKNEAELAARREAENAAREAEAKSRQAELDKKRLELKDWQAKSTAERRAILEKERADRQKEQEQALQKMESEAERNAIAAAKAEAERLAKSQAQQRAIQEQAGELARKKAQEWEAQQQKLAESKLPAKKTAPASKDFFSAFRKPETKPAPEAASTKFDVEIDLSKVMPVSSASPKASKAAVKKPMFDLSKLNELIPSVPPTAASAPVARKQDPPKSATKSSSNPLSGFFESAPSPKNDQAPAPKTVSRPASTTKPKSSESNPLFEFFDSIKAPSPSPAPQVAPPVKEFDVTDPVTEAFASFFGSKKSVTPTTLAPKTNPPSLAPALKNSSPSFSFFGNPSAKKATPAPSPVPAPTPPSPAFSFFGGAGKPVSKAAPVPVPTKKRPFSLFGGSQSETAPPKIVQSKPTTSGSINIFGGSPLKSKSSGTLNLFSSQPKSKPAPPKLSNSGGTQQLFGARSKPVTAKTGFFGGGGGKTTAPAGVPTLAKWKQNPDGSITGFISESPNFRSGQKITTSPVKKGVSQGSVVKTGSGSQYYLS
jgi:hypothetical protein